MAVTATQESASKKGKASAKAPKATMSTAEKKPAAHPTSAVMVVEAITKLNDRGGTSLQAIKKYIADVHKVDMTKQSRLICKAIVKAVETGTLTQVKGKGAAGSFKMAANAVKKTAGEKNDVSSPVKKVAKKSLGQRMGPAGRGIKESALPTKKATKAASKPKGNSKNTKETAPAEKPAAKKTAKLKLPKTLPAKSAKPKTGSTKKVATKAKKN